MTSHLSLLHNIILFFKCLEHRILNKYKIICCRAANAMRNHTDEVAHVAGCLAMWHEPTLGSYLGIQRCYGTSSRVDLSESPPALWLLHKPGGATWQVSGFLMWQSNAYRGKTGPKQQFSCPSQMIYNKLLHRWLVSVL